MEQLKGKVAVVTGGGSGIGQGIAQACADAGMRVVIADIEADAARARRERAARGRGSEAIAVRTDVTDRAALDAISPMRPTRRSARFTCCATTPG